LFTAKCSRFEQRARTYRAIKVWWQQIHVINFHLAVKKNSTRFCVVNTPRMLRTRELLRKHVHNDIVTIVVSYVQSAKRAWISIAEAGEYETCLEIPLPDSGLTGACLGGHEPIAELMIARGASDWDGGLYSACRGGHKQIAELMIARGANDWNNGLYGACYGGHKELVELMIAHGANGWNWALYSACRGGHKQIAELMIACGAIECLACRKSMINHLTSTFTCQ
jgi:hypothetical protein